MSKNYIFSSESVGEGHPDKVCDTISDAVLDACLAQDKFSRVACECYVQIPTSSSVGGEIHHPLPKLDFTKIARDTIREIGYCEQRRRVPCRQGCFVNTIITQTIARHRAGRGRPQGQGQENCQSKAHRRPRPHVWLCLQRKRPNSCPRPSCSRIASAANSPASASRQGAVVAPGREVASLRCLRKRQTRGHFNVVIFHAAQRGRGAPRKLKNSASRTSSKRFCRNACSRRKTNFSINSDRTLRRSAGRRATPGLTGRKIIVDSYGGMAVTAEARSPARTRRRWIAAPLTWAAGGQEHRGCKTGCEVRNPVRLRHRLSRSRQRQRGHLRHRDRSGEQNHPRRQPRVQFPALGHH